MKILTNHIGYEPNGPKQAICQTSKEMTLTSFEIVTKDTKEVVFKGQPGAGKKVSHSQDR